MSEQFEDESQMREFSARRLRLAMARKALTVLLAAVVGCGSFGSLKPFQSSIVPRTVELSVRQAKPG